MGWVEIVILAGIAAAAFFAVRYIVRQKKKGKCVGCGQCGECGLDPKKCGNSGKKAE